MNRGIQKTFVSGFYQQVPVKKTAGGETGVAEWRTQTVSGETAAGHGTKNDRIPGWAATSTSFFQST